MATETPASTPLRRLYGYARPYLWVAAFSLACVLITNAFTFAIPWFIKQTIDVLRQPGGAEAVTGYVLLIVVASLGMGLTRWASRVAIFDFNRSVEKDLRSGLFAHIQRLHPGFLQEMSSGDVLSRATNDLNQVRMAIGMGLMLGVNTLTAYVGCITMMLILNWRLAIWAMLPYPVVIVVVRQFGKLMHSRYVAAQESLAVISTHLQESYGGHHVVQAYTREGHEIASFGEINDDYVAKNMAVVRMWGMFQPIMASVSGIGSLIVLWVGGRAVINGQMTLGEFVAFNSYLAMLIWPTMALGWVMSLVQRGSAAMQRIEELFQRRPDIADGPGPGPVPATGDGMRVAPRVEFRHFTFRYPTPPEAEGKPASDGTPVERHATGEPVLVDVNLIVEPGETVAIMGLIGAGKSTLIQALPRLIPVEPGQVFVGGVDVTAMPLAELRRLFGFVPQDAFLFSRPLAENIAYGEPVDGPLAAELAGGGRPPHPSPLPKGEGVSRDELIAAEVRHWAAVANLAEDVGQFPRGYDTEIGERGVTLSGGQRQRATIARALFLQAPVLIFDDSFSSVDTGTEWAILRDMRRELRGRTVLIVTHRVSTAQPADRIVVLEGGRITQLGSHAELLRQDGLYARLYRRQQLAQEVESL